MPAYNAERYLRPAIESILAQSFPDFEFIIIDDGSSDHTSAIVESYSDARIRLFKQANRGLAATLNRAVQLSRGHLLARQDADDVAHPERFAKQKGFLDSHPEIAMVGSAAEIWVEDKPSGRYHRHPCDPADLALAMLFDNYFVHSSVMIRKAAMDEVGPYTSARDRQPEDFELWSRLARRWALANLPDNLEIYRERSGSICRTDDFEGNCIMIASENIAFALGRKEPMEIDRHLASLMRGQRPGGEKIDLAAIEALLANLVNRIGTRFGISDAENWNAAIKRREALRHQYDRYYSPWSFIRKLRRRAGMTAQMVHSLIK